MANIDENKLISFQLAPQKKSRFQKAKEEELLKKSQADSAAAKALEDFKSSFADSGNKDNGHGGAGRKAFVRRGETLDDSSYFSSGGASISTASASLSSSSALSSLGHSKIGDGGKPKGGRMIDNLFEEIKAKQDGTGGHSNSMMSSNTPSNDYFDSNMTAKGSFDTGDKDTTNLFVNGLSPTLTEEMLLEKFSKFGEINSVKIMWPRTDEERARNKNKGFVSFMRRKDAEDALIVLNDSILDGYRITIGWGKAVKLNPVAINPSFPTQPSSSSGSSSSSSSSSSGSGSSGSSNNISNKNNGSSDLGDSGDSSKISSIASSSSSSSSISIAVTAFEGAKVAAALVDPSVDSRKNYNLSGARPAPTNPLETYYKEGDPSIVISPPANPYQIDSKVREIIDLLALYVSRDGDAFEKVVRQREAYNPDFAFLYNPDSAEGQYYRWRTFSYVMGDSNYSWYTKPFRYNINGIFIIPPNESFFMIKKVEKVDKKRARDSDIDSEKIRELLLMQRKKENDKRFTGMTGAQIEKILAQENEMTSTSSFVTSHNIKSVPLDEEDYEEFENILKYLTLDRSKIKYAMGFAYDHIESCDEVSKLLYLSLMKTDATYPLRIARLFLLSDILFNTMSTVRNAGHYRTIIQQYLPEIMDSLGDMFRSISGRLTAKQVEEHVKSTFAAWSEWSIFAGTPMYLMGIEAMFYKTFGAISSITKAIESNFAALESLEAEEANDPENIDKIALCKAIKRLQSENFPRLPSIFNNLTVNKDSNPLFLDMLGEVILKKAAMYGIYLEHQALDKIAGVELLVKIDYIEKYVRNKIRGDAKVENEMAHDSNSNNSSSNNNISSNISKQGSSSAISINNHSSYSDSNHHLEKHKKSNMIHGGYKSNDDDDDDDDEVYESRAASEPHYSRFVEDIDGEDIDGACIDGDESSKGFYIQSSSASYNNDSGSSNSSRNNNSSSSHNSKANTDFEDIDEENIDGEPMEDIDGECID